MKKLCLLLALLLSLCALCTPLTARAEMCEWYDYDNDGRVVSDDAVYLLRHVLFPTDYPTDKITDLDNSGETSSDDAVCLLRYVLFPADYPLCDHDESARVTDIAPGSDHDGAWHTECMECGIVLHSGIIPRTGGTGTDAPAISEDGEYTSKDDVALYLHVYGKLPSNFITKEEAQSLGWKSGDLWKFAPGKSLGGDEFFNREGLLPKKNGRKWWECDIGYKGGKRNSLRLVWSNDGLIYYTDDHYESFTQLY